MKVNAVTCYTCLGPSVTHEPDLAPGLLLSTEHPVYCAYLYLCTFIQPSANDLFLRMLCFWLHHCLAYMLCFWLHHCLAHGAQVGAEIVLGDRDQRMTMQRMTALASQYRRKAMRQPTDQQLIPRHSSSQHGGLAWCALYACSSQMSAVLLGCEQHCNTIMSIGFDRDYLRSSTISVLAAAATGSSIS